MIGIYKITNTVNGKVYIGQSLNIQKRWWTESKKQEVNPHLKASFLKYGINCFCFEVLKEFSKNEDTALLRKKLNLYETTYIAIYQSNNEEYGYNKTSGGRNNWVISDDSRKRISEAQRGKKQSKETIEKRKQSNQGFRHSKETKRTLSEIKKGTKHSEETKKHFSEIRRGISRPKEWYSYLPKILCVETGEIFDNASVAGRYINKGPAKILDVCKGQRKTAYSFHWRYA